MLYYDGIGVSGKVDIIKASASSEECDICLYRYFLDKVFKFQSDLWYGCHDVLLMSMNLSDVSILNIHGFDCCIINRISKSEPVNLLQNVNLTEKSRRWNMIFLCFVQMMGKESEVEKHKFHHHKNLILLEVIDIKNIQLSSMVFSGKKNMNVLVVTKPMIRKLNHYT